MVNGRNSRLSTIQTNLDNMRSKSKTRDREATEMVIRMMKTVIFRGVSSNSFPGYEMFSAYSGKAEQLQF